MRYFQIKNHGSSVVEIMGVIVFVLAIMVAFGGYIQRGIAGHGKALGDSLGQGRQYDPRGFGAAGELGGTLDCFLDTTADDVTTYNHWIDEACYKARNCDCTLRRFDGAKLPEYTTRCEECKNSCIRDADCQ